MMDHRRRPRALFAAFAFVAFATPASAARFDGAWTMTALTTRGHCGTIPVGMVISKGRISATSGSYAFNPIRSTGHVSASGRVRFRWHSEKSDIDFLSDLDRIVTSRTRWRLGCGGRKQMDKGVRSGWCSASSISLGG